MVLKKYTHVLISFPSKNFPPPTKRGIHKNNKIFVITLVKTFTK